jgi:PIN domain nuclease of toxin-antitoxin system
VDGRGSDISIRVRRPLKILFDTHVILWAFDDPECLSADLLTAIRTGAHKVASVASLWEVALKIARGKLVAPDDLPDRLIKAGFEILPVTARHAWAVRSASDHLETADPFDRLLFTQAKLEGLTLATRDRALLRSGAAVLEA